MTHWRRSLATSSPPLETSDVSQAARDIIAMGLFFITRGGIAVLFGVLLFLCTLRRHPAKAGGRSATDLI